MIRAIHISDSHLGLTLYGSMDSTHKINTRTLEGLSILDWTIEKAINEADILFISGDIYENANPINRVRKEFEKRLVYCNQKGLPVVFIPGNHCTPKSEGSIHPFTADRIFSLPNIFLVDEVGLQKVTAKNGEIIEVLGLPHLYPKDWKMHGENSSEAVANIIKNVKVGANAAVVLGHLSLVGIKNTFSNGNLFTEEFLVAKEVFQSTDKFGAFLLGHIHQPIFVDDKIWYSGSLFPNDFGEEEDKKGCVYFEIDEKNHVSNRQFVPFVSYTRFKTVKIDVEAEDSDPTNVILKSIINVGPDACIVRVLFNVTEKQLLQVDMNKIRVALKDSIHFDISYDVSDNVVEDNQSTINTQSKPSDAVEKFCELKGGEYKEASKGLIALTDELMFEVIADRENKIKSLE